MHAAPCWQGVLCLLCCCTSEEIPGMSAECNQGLSDAATVNLEYFDSRCYDNCRLELSTSDCTTVRSMRLVDARVRVIRHRADMRRECGDVRGSVLEASRCAVHEVCVCACVCVHARRRGWLCTHAPATRVVAASVRSPHTGI